MAFTNSVSQNPLSLIQTLITASGLVLIALAIFLDARARRVANLIQLTQQHRDLWQRLFSEPELSRILDPVADPLEMPVTAQEEMFVIFIILHLSSTYYGTRSGFFRKLHGLKRDVARFFSLPIPRKIWEKMKDLQEPPFLRFVEQCLFDPE